MINTQRNLQSLLAFIVVGCLVIASILLLGHSHRVVTNTLDSNSLTNSFSSVQSSSNNASSQPSAPSLLSSTDDSPLVSVNVRKLPVAYALGTGEQHLQVRLASLEFNGTKGPEGATLAQALDLDLTFVNSGKAAITLDPQTIALKDGQGHSYTPIQSNEFKIKQLNSGAENNFHLSYNLPVTATGLKIFYTNSSIDQTTLVFNLAGH